MVTATSRSLEIYDELVQVLILKGGRQNASSCNRSTGLTLGRPGNIDEHVQIDPFTKFFARWGSEAHIFFYRLTGGTGTFNRDICILSTRGRQTGRTISRPLWFLERDGHYHLVPSFGGSDVAPGWYKNLVANPEVEIEVGRSRKRARARTLSDEEAEEIWPDILARNPIYATYRKRTSRKIPIVEVAPQ